MYYLKLNASGDLATEKETAKRYGINGEIYLVTSVTSDPTIWSGFKAFCPTEDDGKMFKDTYVPYEGVSQKVGDFETNADGVKRQGTYTWEYTYYVPRRAGEMVTLKAPVANGSGGAHLLIIQPIGVGMTTRPIVQMIEFLSLREVY